MMNKLNPLVTDKKTLIKTKYLSVYEEKNYRKWIISTNHLESLRASEKQRRLAVFDVSDDFIGQDEYFSVLAKLLDERSSSVEFVQEVANHLYTYWMRLEITTNLTKIIQTEAITGIQEISMSSPIAFWNCIHQFRWICSEPISINLKDVKDRPSVVAVTKQELHKLYQMWCKSSGESPANDRWFYIKLKSGWVKLEECQRDKTYCVVINVDVMKYILKNNVESLLMTPDEKNKDIEIVASHIYLQLASISFKFNNSMEKELDDFYIAIKTHGVLPILSLDCVKQYLRYTDEQLSMFKNYCDQHKVLWQKELDPMSAPSPSH